MHLLAAALLHVGRGRRVRYTAPAFAYWAQASASYTCNLDIDASYFCIDQVRSLAFSADGTKLVSGSDDMKIFVRDPQTGHRLMALEAHRYRMSLCQLVVVSVTVSVCIWCSPTFQGGGEDAPPASVCLT